MFRGVWSTLTSKSYNFFVNNVFTNLTFSGLSDISWCNLGLATVWIRTSSSRIGSERYDDRVEGYDKALAQFVTYLESNWVGTPRAHAPHKKPRFPITTWTINESVLEGTKFSTNSSESWNSVSKLSVVAKPSLWQLILQLKAEDSTARAKMMSIRAGTWKDRNPGRSARREEKKKAMRNIVLDYYTMNTGIFLDSAITFFNEF